jgi:hypothetical protein
MQVVLEQNPVASRESLRGADLSFFGGIGRYGRTQTRPSMTKAAPRKR